MTFLIIYIIGVIASIAINIYAYYKDNEDITLGDIPMFIGMSMFSWITVFMIGIICFGDIVIIHNSNRKDNGKANKSK